MKALILAGGYGTRLRPLSCRRPKQMFPVANRPILDWILEGLSRKGVSHVILAVNYMADILEKNFGRSKYGVDITYSLERKPLGTGGPIKRAESLLIKDGEPFFVLNGDILSSIDYAKLYEEHVRKGAEATIALQEVENPSGFGVVEISPDNRIHRFVEKPDPREAPSKLINAGVYVLDQCIFDLIPNEENVSIEYDVFPVLASRERLFGYIHDGLWLDVGKPDDYLAANRLMLDSMDGETTINCENRIDPSVRIVPPVAIGKGVVAEEDALIGPYTAIGDGVLIKKGARIENSVVFTEAWIDSFASIKGAIVGEGAIIGRWVKIEDGCIVGDHAIINDNVTLTKKVKVCPSKAVKDSVLEPCTVM